jgi:PhnB protein
MAIKPIPEGYHSIAPYLIVEGAPKLLEFLKQAFGAQEIARIAGPDGAIGHAEARVGDSHVMLAEASPDYPPISSAIHLYVEDVDATYGRALAAGAVSVMAPNDQFYGDRRADVIDPVGNRWFVATHTEDLTPDEMKRRMDAAMKQGQG